ncbi:MAG: hypothetical protein M0T80_11085 [Actinomycetota bacterium]|nr:hypothetical protein [Actinomycetota bacterium]
MLRIGPGVAPGKAASHGQGAAVGLAAVEVLGGEPVPVVPVVPSAGVLAPVDALVLGGVTPASTTHDGTPAFGELPLVVLVAAAGELPLVVLVAAAGELPLVVLVAAAGELACADGVCSASSGAALAGVAGGADDGFTVERSATGSDARRSGVGEAVA